MERRQTFLGLLGYLFIGTAAVLVPSVMPFITEEFMATGLTLAAIGLLFPARSVGGIVGNLLSGVGSDLLGRQRLVWLSALLLAASLALVAGARPWILFLAGFLLVSAAQGALSTGINAMIADANRESRARALNTLHGIYGLGAALSPLIIGVLIDRGLAWRWALGGTGLIWLLYGLIAYLFARGGGEARAEEQPQKPNFAMLRQGPFLSLFVIAFAYNGIAVSLLGWIALFMGRWSGSSTLLSVSMISVFYVALTLGRFLCAAFSERAGYATTLLVLACGITLTYPLVLLDALPLVAAGVFLTGLSLSGLFPTAMAYGARLYAEQTGTVSGTLNVSMALGAMIPPLWTGIMADAWGFQTALGVNYVMAPPLILLAIYLSRVEVRSVVSEHRS
ncbi:MAG: MFS transporter [Caldilineaceae bacterium]|nr:MFS transporter [Caldilineaceae bacterium]